MFIIARRLVRARARALSFSRVTNHIHTPNRSSNDNNNIHMICSSQILIYSPRIFFSFLFFNYLVICLFIIGFLIIRLVLSLSLWTRNVVDREPYELVPVLRSDEFSSSPILVTVVTVQQTTGMGGCPLQAHLIVFCRSISCLYNDAATSSSSSSFIFLPWTNKIGTPVNKERRASLNTSKVAGKDDDDNNEVNRTR